MGRIVGDSLQETADRVNEVHTALVGRGYRGLRRVVGRRGGSTVDRVEHVHTAALDGVARRIGRALHTAGHLGGRVGARLTDGQPVVQERLAHDVVSVLNGVTGDRLQASGSALQLPMALRAAGRDVPLTEQGVRAAYPTAGPLIVVFLHGLIETDAWWDIRSERNWGRPGESYTARLAAEGVWTPVRLRYNTGLRVSANGAELDALLERLVAVWPVPVTGLVLVGHSMGGLVLHSALVQAGPDRRWPGLVRTTVTIGTPHRGSSLARFSAKATPVLARVPETQWLADALRGSAAGIRDLRFGSLLPGDGGDRDPDGPPPGAAVPLRAGVRHCVVVGTVPLHRDGWLAGLIGDLLVRPGDAVPAPERGPIQPRDVRLVGGARHLDLLNHPAVYVHLSEWLADAARHSPPGGTGPG